MTESRPRLSPDFSAQLHRRLEQSLTVRPVKGWRKAAMLGYAALSLLGAVRILSYVPMPSLDSGSAWMPVIMYSLVPLSFLLALAASRLLPAPDGKQGGINSLALGL